MAQAEQKENWEKAEAASKRLQSTLSKLQGDADQRLQKEYGLSKGFQESVKTEEEAMQLCETAMERLAMEYVRNLEAFREAENPEDALRFLEQAEVIWKAETAVIRDLDQDSSQSAFFQEMRQLALRVLEDRLYEAATACSHNASAENVALVIANLAVIDTIWDEMGFPPSHPERQNIRKTVLQFSD